jgi:hypothetical protein
MLNSSILTSKQVHGPAERGSSGDVTASKLQELGAWFLARLRKPLIHFLNERKQMASAGMRECCPC